MKENMVVYSEDHREETCRRGRIEVICGSMFSVNGKSDDGVCAGLLFAHQRVEIFKPSIDTRYSEEEVVSHDNNSIKSTPIDSSASILLFTSEIDVVGIDEAQFFDDGYLKCVTNWPIAACGLLSQGLIWILKEFRLGRFLHCVPLQTK